MPLEEYEKELRKGLRDKVHSAFIDNKNKIVVKPCI